MNIALFTDDFYPNTGGIADVLMNIFKQFKKQEGNLFLFNPYTEGINMFNTLSIDNVKLKRFFSLLKTKNFYKYTLLSFWRVLCDKKIPFFHRLRIIAYLFIKPKTFLYVINNIIKLYRDLKNMQIDLIIAGNSGRTLPLCFFISRVLKKKLITIAHGLDFLKKNKYSFKSHYFRNTDKVITTTNSVKEIIKEMHHIDDDRLKVINIGVDTNTLQVKETKAELRKQFCFDKDEFIILSVGRHVRRKNFQLVISALDEINHLYNHPNIVYVLIGEGEQTNDLKAFAKEFDIEDQVLFIGHCSYEIRNKYYKMSDLFIMPSITSKNDIEGFGIVFLEANYFNLPVIGTATGGMSEAIIHGETGFLIKQNDLMDLVDAIIFLYDNKFEREGMGENGYFRVVKDFKWENIIKDYITLINKLKDDL